MQNVKGTYDFFGKDQALRKKVQNTLAEVFELYDFDGMDSAILNERELLTAKYAGGDEIVKEMYQLTDQGERKLGLRYDLTIPFAKVVAQNPGLIFPYKRYEIGKVFRDGPVKRGRLREFLQCDVDVVGIPGPEAEAELMQVAVEGFARLEIPIILRWNNRRFLGDVLEAVGVQPEDKLSVMLTLDKLEKIGRGGVLQELADKKLDAQAVSALAEMMEMENPTFERLSSIYAIRETKGAQEVLRLQALLHKLGLEETCRFDPFLSRGLSFYTGTIYEIFDASGSLSSSLGGGGRYDAIIGTLVGREDLPYPAVGISFGMEAIMALLADRNVETPKADVTVIPIGDTAAAALQTAALLRSGGIRTSVEVTGRKLKNALATASTRGTQYVILIGEDEVAAGMLRLKDMNAGTERVLPLEEAVHILTKAIM
ncbi:histidine--tRNA ligase [Gorillibacterium massiliense]|uniref:histidine--tRNA ligase n=1 Tax=Gorillibacterium massiliense TaxID=1280390 RepID=UPI0004B1B207|nr:histidine--tRNA ligase [Gorillibacterium massiliense]